jgi:hypothetical protein
MKKTEFTERQLITLYDTGAYFVVEFDGYVEIWCIKNSKCQLFPYHDICRTPKEWRTINWNCSLTKKEVARGIKSWKTYKITRFETHLDLIKHFDIEKAPNDK